MNRIVVGVDIAKRVSFRDWRWMQPRRARLWRCNLSGRGFLEHFANRSKCLIGMEACGGSQHWARALQKLGHEVKLLLGRDGEAARGCNKNDAADAREFGWQFSIRGSRRWRSRARSSKRVGAASDERAVGEASHGADQWSGGLLTEYGVK